MIGGMSGHSSRPIYTPTRSSLCLLCLPSTIGSASAWTMSGTCLADSARQGHWRRSGCSLREVDRIGSICIVSNKEEVERVI